MASELPQGFTLDQPQAQSLPQGFILDNQEEVQNVISIPEQIGGGISGAATLAGDIVGSGVGGLTALVDVLNPFTDNDPVKLLESVKSKFNVAPSEGGERALQQISEIVESSGAGDILKSVKAFQDRAGNQGLDLTGSPAFATFVQMIPDIIAEAGGAGVGRRVATNAAISPAVNQAKNTAMSAVTRADDATGITQLTSDVMPPETRLGKLLQSQGELVAGFQRRGQQNQRVQAIESLVNKFDITEGARFEEKIVAGLKNSIQASKKEIGRLYDESSSKLDNLGSVPLTKTKEFSQEIIDRELKKGTKANQSVIDDMQSFVDAPDDLSFELIKEIRTGVGANLEKVNRGAPVQGNTDTGLLKRTYAQLTNDMNDFAQNADPDLANQWRKANKFVSEFATGTSKQGAKAIIKSGDATPEIVDRLLFSDKNSDLEFLSANLDASGKQAAKQRVLQRALDKSSIDGEDINPNKFLSQLNKSRNQFRNLFTPDERKGITALRTQLAKTRRAQDASVATPTGQQLTIGAALALPQALIPGVVQGFVESKPIRNLLIRRQAAKNARSIALIDADLQSKISELGLSGALITPNITEQEEN